MLSRTGINQYLPPNLRSPDHFEFFSVILGTSSKRSQNWHKLQLKIKHEVHPILHVNETLRASVDKTPMDTDNGRSIAVTLTQAGHGQSSRIATEKSKLGRFRRFTASAARSDTARRRSSTLGLRGGAGRRNMEGRVLWRWRECGQRWKRGGDWLNPSLDRSIWQSHHDFCPSQFTLAKRTQDLYQLLAQFDLVCRALCLKTVSVWQRYWHKSLCKLHHINPQFNIHFVMEAYNIWAYVGHTVMERCHQLPLKRQYTLQFNDYTRYESPSPQVLLIDKLTSFWDDFLTK